MNPTASIADTSFTPDLLIARNAEDLLNTKVTLKTPENRTRGALLGKVTIGAVTAEADAGNTGNGVLSGAAVGSAGVPQQGVYRIVAVEPITNLGTFVVYDPQGVEIGRYITGAAAFNNQITFAIADGATDFVAGDAFSITVAAGSGKYLLAVAAATDGSQIPRAVLAQDADASAADVDAIVYTRGWFNETQLTLGAGITAAAVRDALALLGIILVPAALA